MSLTSTFLRRQEVLLLPLAAVCIKYGRTRLNGNTIDGIVLIDGDVNTLGDCLLSTRQSDGKRLEEHVAEDRFFRTGHICRQDALYDSVGVADTFCAV